MNRREMLAAGGAGVVGLFLPQKVISEVGVPGLVLENLTDEEMAQLVGEFPQSETSVQVIYRLRTIDTAELGPPWLLALQEHSFWGSCSWRVEGTVAYVTREGLKSLSLDIKFLKEIEFYYARPRPDPEKEYMPRRLPDIIFKRKNGVWFGRDLR